MATRRSNITFPGKNPEEKFRELIVKENLNFQMDESKNEKSVAVLNGRKLNMNVPRVA